MIITKKIAINLVNGKSTTFEFNCFSESYRYLSKHKTLRSFVSSMIVNTNELNDFYWMKKTTKEKIQSVLDEYLIGFTLSDFWVKIEKITIEE